MSLPVWKWSVENCGRESVNGACLPCRPPTRPLGRRQYPGALKGCGVKIGYDLMVSIRLTSRRNFYRIHYNGVIMGAIASQITSLTVVYSIVYWDADQRKHQSSASLAFVRGIHRGPVNSPHKWPVTRKMFLFDDVIISSEFRWKKIVREKGPWGLSH